MDKNADGRHYNLPYCMHAAVIPGDGSEERSDHRDIVVQTYWGWFEMYQPSASQLFNSSLHYALSKG